jgi:hypothetical protein
VAMYGLDYMFNYSTGNSHIALYQFVLIA